jgi:hypothetical protein
VVVAEQDKVVTLTGNASCADFKILVEMTPSASPVIPRKALPGSTVPPDSLVGVAPSYRYTRVGTTPTGQ